MESQARILKRNLRRRGLDHNDNKANKRKQLSDILFILHGVATNHSDKIHLLILILNSSLFFTCTPRTDIQAERGRYTIRHRANVHSK